MQSGTGAHRVIHFTAGTSGHGESIGAHGESIGAHQGAPVWSDPSLTPGSDFFTVPVGNGETIDLCPVCYAELVQSILNDLLAASQVGAHGESIGAHGESIGAHYSRPLGYGG